MRYQCELLQPKERASRLLLFWNRSKFEVRSRMIHVIQLLRRSNGFFSLSIGVHIKHEFDQIMSISYTISPSQCELRWRFAWNSFYDMFRWCSSSNRNSIPSFYISSICILNFDRISRKCQRNAAAPVRTNTRVCVLLLFTKHLSIKTNSNFFTTHKTTPDQAVIIRLRCRSEYMHTVHLLLKYWHDAPICLL